MSEVGSEKLLKHAPFPTCFFVKGFFLIFDYLVLQIVLRFKPKSCTTYDRTSRLFICVLQTLVSINSI